MNRLKEARGKFIVSIDVGEQTKTVYGKAIRYFFDWWEAKSENKVTTQLVREYKDWLKTDRTISTVRLYLVGIKQFFNFCVRQGLLKRNPAEGVGTSATNHRHKKRDLSRGEIKKLFQSVDTNTLKGKRDFLIINLMVRCGLRRIEIERANMDDIEERQGKKLLWVKGKGREDRDEFVVLMKPVQQAIDDWSQVKPQAKSKALIVSLASKNKGERLSKRSISRSVNYYLEKAGLKSSKVTPHSLRHSFITLAIEAGAPLERVQIAARHKSVCTTQIYFHEHSRLTQPVEGLISI